MSRETNIRVVEKYFEAATKGDASVLDEILSGDFILHGAAEYDREALKNAFLHRRPSPDFVTKVEDMVVDEDKIAVRTADSDTQQIQIGNNAPTEKKANYSRFVIFHLKNGLITDAWMVVDLLSRYQQLGFLPPRAEIEKEIRKE